MVTETADALKEQNKNEINECYEDIRNIYVNYRTLIRPFIAFLELFDSEFPVEILNEVRAILQHLARCYYSEIEENGNSERKISVRKNLDKAEGHINRALLDCFKYSCLTLFDEYKFFMNTYKHVDLSSLDNGEFLKNLHNLKEAAKKADKEARSLEGDSGDDNEVFEKYEIAFNKSVALYDYIDKHAQYAAKLRRKLRIYNIGAAIGWFIGVVSGGHALWVAFGDKIVSFVGSLLGLL